MSQPEPQSVTLKQISDLIVSEHYFTALQGAEHPDAVNLNPPTGPLGLLTFCVLVMRNGFTLVGQSACADPLKFDAAIGRAWAQKDALTKAWPLLGYQLKESMYQQNQQGASE